MSANTPATAQGETATDELSSSRGRRRKLITALMILAFLAIIAIALYALSLIAGAVILLLLSALLAYIIYPLVQLLQRRLLRSLAIGVAYLLVAGAVVGGMFIVASALIQQSTSLVHSIQFLLSPAGQRQLQPFIAFLGKLGITQDQVAQVKNQLLSQVLAALSGLFPFLSGLFTNIINLIVVITLSVYFVVDGPRILGWLRLKTPVTRRDTMNFLLHALDQSLGGYLRGTLLIALLGALATGVGLALLHVPYAALLGTLFFFLYFVPVIGAYVIGVLCILAALPEGLVVTLIVAGSAPEFSSTTARSSRHAFSAKQSESIPLWPFSRSSLAQNSSDCSGDFLRYLLLAFSSTSSWLSGTGGKMSIPSNSRQKSRLFNHQRRCPDNRLLRQIHPSPV